MVKVFPHSFSSFSCSSEECDRSSHPLRSLSSQKLLQSCLPAPAPNKHRFHKPTLLPESLRFSLSFAFPLPAEILQTALPPSFSFAFRADPDSNLRHKDIFLLSAQKLMRNLRLLVFYGGQKKKLSREYRFPNARRTLSSYTAVASARLVFSENRRFRSTSGSSKPLP